jgi:bifunctional DNase/RNase
MHRRAWAVAAVIGLAAALLPVAAPSAENPAAGAAPYEMEVLGVQGDPQSGAVAVLLRTKQDKRELTIFIGPVEANAIAIPLQGMRPPRPLTHDLLLDVLHRLRGKVKRAVITELRENTFYANLVLDVQGQEMSVDARPSDAIALALREGAPILAAEPAFVRSQRPEPPAERGKP